MTRAVPSLALAFALLLGAVVPAASAAAVRGPLVEATADLRYAGPTVPESFIGFSDEYTVVPAHVGTPESGPIPAVAQLFDNLAAFGGGPPTYRIGGGSSDGSWYQPARPEKPTGAYFAITDGWVRALRAFTDRTRSPLVIGLNMGLNRPDLAVEWARAAKQAFPTVRAFEIGNEPDLFWERVVSGVTPKTAMRSRRWDAADYVRELRSFTRALTPVVGRALAGPAFCCGPDFLRYTPQIVHDQRGRLGLVTIHRYPLISCEAKPGEKAYPTPRKLLSKGALVGPTRLFDQVVRVGRRYGLKVRVTETNSVACGGAVGASDVFASALWAADWYFTMAAVGVAGADMHASSPLYAPFSTGFVDGEWKTAVGAVYHGLLLFAETVGHRGRLLPSTYFGARVRRGANVKVWGVRDRARREVRVAVIAKGGAGGRVDLRVRGARGAGTLKRLIAPSVRSRKGITWGGQAFAWPTTPDGKLTGTPVTERVTRRPGGVYRFRLRGGSAAMLTVSR